MLLRKTALLLVILTGAAAYASEVFVSKPFPLTNTRYGLNGGFNQQLVTNGREVFLFWESQTHFHYRRVDWSASAQSRSILKAAPGGRFDYGYSAVWTGSRFLLVTAEHDGSKPAYYDEVIGQAIDGNGELLGERFRILEQSHNPAVVFDGQSAVLFDEQNQIVMLRLSPAGTPVSSTTTGLSGSIARVASNGKSFAVVLSNPRRLALLDHGGNVTASSTLPDGYLPLSIAANGDGYLLAMSEPTLQTRLVAANGSIGPPLELAPGQSDVRFPEAAWTGSRWIVAYDGPTSLAFSVAQIDANNTAIEQRARYTGRIPAVLATQDRVLVAWPSMESIDSAIQFTELPLGDAPSVTASITATRQEIAATASASHGTLVVWYENDAVHAGVRTADGGWSEERIWASVPDAVSAATDGQTFAVVLTERDRGGQLLHLDRDGKLIGQPEHVPNDYYPSLEVHWTGREYVVASPWNIAGTVATPATRPDSTLIGGMATLAASGDGYYLVWLFGGNFGSPTWPSAGVAGMRLGPDFKPLDPAPTIFAQDPVLSSFVQGCDVAWDGRQYVVAWAGLGHGLTVAHVPSNGGPPVIRLTDTDKNLAAAPQLTPAADGVAVYWKQVPATIHEVTNYRLLLLSRDGAIANAGTFAPAPDRLVSRLYYSGLPLLRVATLPGGDVAIVRTALEDANARLAMNVLSFTPLPLLPEPPRITAVSNGALVEIRWDSPPRPVNGSRVEYRIDDQPWLEIDRVVPSSRRAVAIPAPAGRKTLFRVRAWNEGGVGAYSAAVEPQITPGRRRSAR